MTYKQDNCECGIDEKGQWSDTVFDRFGCDCGETERAIEQRTLTQPKPALAEARDFARYLTDVLAPDLREYSMRETALDVEKAAQMLEALADD